MSEIKACPLIKACPFCGFDTICEENHLIICLNCGTSNHISEWNTRPIEDALQARIAELESELNLLKQERDDNRGIFRL